MNNGLISPSTRRHIIAVGVIGNLLDMYDVMICAFLAQTIAATFFPPHDESLSLIKVFYIFLVGYLSRPFGSFIISLFADQLGRKKILLISIFTVGMSTTIISIIPSYSTIGVLSIVLFLIFRILQNVFAGGEYISSIAYLIENADKGKRGFLGCWAAVGVNGGTLIASLVVFIMMYLIDIEVIPAWCWRFAFVPAFIGMGIGLWMRLSIPESIDFILENANTNKIRKLDILKNSINVIRSLPFHCIGVAAITWLGVSITSAFYIYSPIHLNTINHFSKHESFSINTLSLALVVLLIPIFGFISDYINKITLLKIISAIFFILALPYYWYLSYGNYYEVLLLQAAVSVPSACFFSVAPVIIAETFPTRVRCTTISLIYQLVSSLSAGFTPIILLYLTNQTHVPYSPAYLVITSSIMGFLCLFLLKDKQSQLNESQIHYLADFN